MNDLLRYRRQFLVASEFVEGLWDWQHRVIRDIHLFAHPDLEVTVNEGPSVLVVLLGCVFDPFHPGYSNEDILSEVISKVGSFNGLIGVLKAYAGRYALIYKDPSDFVVLHDPLGLREIYYCTRPNRVICGSQPNLLNRFSEPRLGVRQDPEVVEFYNKDIKLVRNGRLWVGDETYYQDIKHLMPNHCLDIRSLTATRYWPNSMLERIDLGTAVRKSCDYLKGVIKAVTSRYDVMLAVTSGIDSRSLLAASKDVQERIYYFINQKPPLNGNSADIRVPRSMFVKLDIPFHIHEVSGSVDEEFKKIFLDNTFMSSELLLETIYNVYYKNHQNKVNLLGVGEIGRDYYGEAPRDLDGYYLAHCLKYRSSRYATAQCAKWLREVRPAVEKYNVDIMRLFLWEMLLGSWGAVGNSESDIAIEEFDPYDSHYLYETLLSVHPKYTKGSVPQLFKAMYMEMWPELLNFPFNPPDSFKDRVKACLGDVGIYAGLKRIRYKYDRWRFRKELSSLEVWTGS